MRYTIIMLLLVLNGSIAFAQGNPVFEWAFNTRGAQSLALKTDDSGNLYTCGMFYGTQDFDPGPAAYELVSNGDADIFVSKFSPSGKLLWAKRLGGVSYEQAGAMTLDDSGNIHIVGMYRMFVDFDPGPGSFVLSAGIYGSIFVLKLDRNGDFIWARSFDGEGYNFPHDIAVDHSGNVYTVGDMATKIDFDPGSGDFILESNGNFDIYISKLDSAGRFAWAINIGDTSYSYAYKVTTDIPGNIYIAGHYKGAIDFDPGPDTFVLRSTGNVSMYLLKLDASSGFIWAGQVGGTGTVVCNDIMTDSFSNIFATGYFTNKADFDPGPDSSILTAPTQNAFVLKWDSSGKRILNKKLGANFSTYGSAIALDDSGNIYTAGYFEQHTDMDPDPDSEKGIYARGKEDMYLSKLDPEGKYLWSAGIGGEGEDRFRAMVFDRSGNMYTGGIFMDVVDFDPGSGVYNLHDGGGFLQKLVPEKLPPSGVQNYFRYTPRIAMLPNPTTGIVLITAGNESEWLLIEVYNSYGQQVFRNQVTGGRNFVDLSASVPGVYFVRVSSAKQVLGGGKIIRQ